MSVRPVAIACLLWLSPQPAAGEPVLVAADQSAAALRRDAGTGVCLTSVHVVSDGSFRTVEDARAQLLLPAGSALIDGKVSVPIKLINLRNSLPEAAGDFTGAGSAEAFFPFSSAPGATPQADDKNIAVRVRGYLNVPAAGVRTLAVLGDDGFELLVGGARVLGPPAGQAGLRQSRQVRFAAPGLYPLEVVHFQNGGAAVLELSQSDDVAAELSGSAEPLPMSYRLLSREQLFSAIAGSSDCTECSDDARCGAARYCKDGLCQRCITQRRCGLACTPCPSGLPACDGARCVECTLADQALCTSRSQVCDPDTLTCTPCREDDQCEAGQLCLRATGGCIPRPYLVYTGGCAAARGDTGGGLIAALLCLVILSSGRARGGFSPQRR